MKTAEAVHIASIRDARRRVDVAREQLQKIATESVAAIVTEGPAHLVSDEIGRVLKPGGHLVCRASLLEAEMLLSTGILEFRAGLIRIEKEPIQTHRDLVIYADKFSLFRKIFDGTVANCLRRHGTGALRRESKERPFFDVHPCSLKAFLDRIRVAVLPLGGSEGHDPFVLDPFHSYSKRAKR